jgi:hypothetical protein
MDISPPHCEDSKPHHAVKTAVIERTMRTTVSRRWPGGCSSGSASVLVSDRSDVLMSLSSAGGGIECLAMSFCYASCVSGCPPNQSQLGPS